MDEDKLASAPKKQRTLENALSQSTEPGKETPRVGT